MGGPWRNEDISKARSVPLLMLLAHVCDYLKEDFDFTPLDSSMGSRRFHANCNKRDFRLILTGEKWLDELVDRGVTSRGGGGAIDLAMYLTRVNFVQAVKVCLDASQGQEVRA